MSGLGVTEKRWEKEGEPMPTLRSMEVGRSPSVMDRRETVWISFRVGISFSS